MQNRVILITGATRGLGIAIAESFAKVGAKVAMNYHSNDAGAQAALSQVSQHGTARIFKADAHSAEGAKQLVSDVREAFGPIDTLVLNSAPFHDEQPIESYTDEDFQRMIKGFLMSPHYLTKAVMGPMKEKSFGRIINITSEVYHLGPPQFTAYTAAKGAQVGYSRSSALELAPYGITVNNVAPGWIPVERHDGTPAETIESYRQTIPVGRIGKREEIAAAVQYFASEQAGFATGQTLILNGGRCLN